MRTLLLGFVILPLISGCANNQSMDEVDYVESSTTVDSEAVTFAQSNWDHTLVQQLNEQLQLEGFEPMLQQSMNFMQADDGSVYGILVPYVGPDNMEAAVLMVDDGDLKVSATIASVNNSTIEEFTIFSFDERQFMRISSAYELEDGKMLLSGCNGDSWCLFWNCMLENCGFASVGCLLSGPGFWGCLLGVCGSSTYFCYVSSF